MSDDMEQQVPIAAAPEWVQRIVDEEELLPEELAKVKAKANGEKVYRAIYSKRGSFLICYDQESGEATHIIWVV